jgi:hypothetical protein
VLLHASLALLATPLAPGLLIVGRLATARSWLAALVALGWTAGTTAAGLAIAFYLPVSLWTAASLIAAVWLVAGIGLSLLEVSYEVTPPLEIVPERRLGRQIATWTCATVIALVPWAFLLAALFSRWGSAFFAKPSMAKQVVQMVLLFLVPLGAALGLARGLLRRPHRPGPPALFGLANAAVLGSISGALLLYDWLETELIGLESLNTTPTLTEAWFLVMLGILAGPMLGFAHYLSESRSVGDFALRWVAAGVALFLFAINAELLTSASPVERRVAAAQAAAAEGSHHRAARQWAWIVSRTPRIAATGTAIRTGARDALEAGRPEMARALLASVDREFSAEVGAVELGEISSRILGTELDLSQIVEAPIHPIRRESYLDSSWSALLTAVRSVWPELQEAQLKSQLRDISTSVAAIELQDVEEMLQLRLVAGLFGCRVLAIPFERHLEVLESGHPVLFFSDASYSWKLLHWSAPGADAVQWLDYSHWGDTGERLDRASSRDLLGVVADAGARDLRILAAVGRLGAQSRLSQRLERKGGWVFVLVDSASEESWLERFPGAASRARHLADVEAARGLFDQRAFSYALRVAAELPAGSSRNELLAASWLDSESRGHIGSDLEAEARAAAYSQLEAGRVRSSSGWFLEHLRSLSEGELGCRYRREALDEMLEIRPWSSALIAERLTLAVSEGDPARAATLALDLAREGEWSSVSVLTALGELAPLAGVGESPEGRAALETLTARVPLLAETADGSVRRRTNLASYCAGRAALIRDIAESTEWWRCAVEHEPLQASFRSRLADALERNGEAWAAARELEQSELLTPARSCETPIDGDGVATASGMGGSGASR